MTVTVNSHFHIDGSKITCRVTELELRRRPKKNITPPPFPVAIIKAEIPTLSFYKFLYQNVGQEWLWWERLTLSDTELEEILYKDSTEIRVLYIHGSPAGFSEISRENPQFVQLDYFGLMPEFIGKNIGDWFLEETIEAAFIPDPAKTLALNTCTFDHPSALRTYQKQGFSVTAQTEKIIDDPRKKGILPLNCATHIPLE